MAEFGKKRITDHDFPPPLKTWGRKIKRKATTEFAFSTTAATKKTTVAMIIMRSFHYAAAVFIIYEFDQ